jgi:hypothetical protein
LKAKPEVAVETLTRITYLTRFYQDLQGYRLLPFALLFVLIAVQGAWLGSMSGWPPSVGPAFYWLMTAGAPLTGCAVALAASHLIGQWYEKRYGQIRSLPKAKLTFSRKTYLIACVLWLLGGLLFGDYGGLGLLSIWLIWQPIPPLLRNRRHLPPAIVYALLAGALGATMTGNSTPADFHYQLLVTRSLGAAGILLAIAAWNHRQFIHLIDAAPRTAEEA